ncbi:MAG: hypothetical protein ACK5U8_18585 [Deltaproteobacteria bacterium]
MAIAPRTNEELLRDVPLLGQLPAADLQLLGEAAELRKIARAAPTR